ncbi:uncharacterized protein N7483_011427 [Penicillium malachiteum]|uniref:uncharacterized protein n=1 Tax=Penicillium malachiteum TaxID=1324776 RepID=UPI0025493EE6|nr:uncharacterized protein N7483_011427 [Penicillium malachiteum]KAJ5714246.1 hypothetical protein N7483_011427 [Penicillium malachiteum]
MSSDDESVHRPGRRGGQSPMGDDHDSDNGNQSPFGAGDDDNDADLFGSDGDDDRIDNDRPPRTLDDEQLDSGDDENRHDRTEDRMDEADDYGYPETVNIMDMGLARAPVPETNDGQVYTMRVPEFLSIEAEEFNPQTYVAPAYSTAATSLCWRKDPKDGSLIQSNARFIRWNDGSMTLQLASSPLEQYRLVTKPLVPLNKAGEYDTKLDSHVYLGAAIETASIFRLTSHVTHGLTVLPTTLETDDAVLKLQASLAAAARGSKQTADGSLPVIDMKEDPEMASRKAEMLEREAMRAERRRQQLADREADRGQKRAAPVPRAAIGLLGALETEGMLGSRPRAKPRRVNRRGEINTDDEEDYGRGGRTREDEYDEDDGFLVGSDEDIEEDADDDDDEVELEDEDMDAEGEVDEEVAPKASRSRPSEPEARAGTPPARKKHRYVVDDEDSDE